MNEMISKINEYEKIQKHYEYLSQHDRHSQETEIILDYCMRLRREICVLAQKANETRILKKIETYKTVKDYFMKIPENYLNEEIICVYMKKLQDEILKLMEGEIK